MRRAPRCSSRFLFYTSRTLDLGVWGCMQLAFHSFHSKFPQASRKGCSFGGGVCEKWPEVRLQAVHSILQLTRIGVDGLASPDRQRQKEQHVPEPGKA